MAVGPFGPTVYSVARTWSVGVNVCVVPSGMVTLAWEPWANSRVACRVPSASEMTLPRATCTGTPEDRSMAVTLGSAGTRATRGTKVKSCHGAWTCRWAGM